MNARARWTGLAGAGVVALLALSGVSCKKGDAVEPASPITVSEFKATAEGHAGDSKTGLNGRDVYWTDGDDARVFSDTDGDGKRYVADGGFGTNTTDFILAGGTGVSGNKFYAVYPYGAVAADGTLTDGSDGKTVEVTIPAVQTCNEAGNFANGANVMAAYAPASNGDGDFESVSLAYQNVCGVLRLTLKGGATVKSIAVRSKGGEALSGKGTITFSETESTTHKLEPVSDGGTSDAVCLLCPGGVRLTGDGVQFNVVVMPCDMTGGFDVLVMCDEGSFRTSTSQANPIGAGRILGMPAVSVSVTEGALPGVFSVGDGETVRFSKGNLQYQASTGTWRFAENQWNFVGTQKATGEYLNCGNVYMGNGTHCDNADIAGDYVGWIDLFGWATGENPTLHTTQNDDYGSGIAAEESFGIGNHPEYDWGSNAISNGGGATNRWRTLTKNEWGYLINTRPGARYAKATVCGVAGLLVFPDGVDESSHTAEVGGVIISEVNQSGAKDSPIEFTVNPIDAAKWQSLEASGFVFLPCAGYRFYQNNNIICDLRSNGNYYSSTAWGPHRAYFLDFQATTVNTNSYGGTSCIGRSVRLVR